jgi:hypothetical protein
LTHAQNFFSLSKVDLLFYAGSTGGALDITLCTCKILPCDPAIMLSIIGGYWSTGEFLLVVQRDITRNDGRPSVYDGSGATPGDFCLLDATL